MDREALSPHPRARRQSPRVSTPFDAVTFLTIYLVLLLAVPSGMRIEALGAAGAPALVWALAGGLWWVAAKLHARRPLLWDLGLLPSVSLIFAATVGVAYVFAVMRASPGIEGNSGDLGLLRTLGWVSVLLIASDGIGAWPRLLTLLRRLSWGGALVAALGLAQFITGQLFIDRLEVPGMSVDWLGVAQRDAFVRAAGTAMHPLEFALILTMILPIALALALHDHSRSVVSRWLPLVPIVSVMAISVSRSALIGLIAAVVVMASVWPWRRQLATLAVAVGVGLSVYVLVPGMGSTILGLFAGLNSDSSTRSRTDSYDLVGWVIGHSPIFGRGLNTFVPAYHILDNQLLLLAIEIGVVGLAAFVALLAAGGWCGRAGRKAASDDLGRDMGQAFVASIIAGGLLLAFFDGLAFAMVGGLMLLVVGLAGAYRRLVGRAQTTVLDVTHITSGGEEERVA